MEQKTLELQKALQYSFVYPFCLSSIYSSQTWPQLPKLKPINARTILWRYRLMSSCIQQRNLHGIKKHWNRRAAEEKPRQRLLRSAIWWFTEFCNSHCVSQFAASFIVVRAKTSIAESFFFCSKFFPTAFHTASPYGVPRTTLDWFGKSRRTKRKFKVER